MCLYVYYGHSAVLLRHPEIALQNAQIARYVAYFMQTAHFFGSIGCPYHFLEPLCGTNSPDGLQTASFRIKIARFGCFRVLFNANTRNIRRFFYLNGAFIGSSVRSQCVHDVFWPINSPDGRQTASFLMKTGDFGVSRYYLTRKPALIGIFYA